MDNIEFICKMQMAYRGCKKAREDCTHAYLDLQSRIYKAVEYINNHYLEPNEPKLLSILQGKEVKNND